MINIPKCWNVSLSNIQFSSVLGTQLVANKFVAQTEKAFSSVITQIRSNQQQQPEHTYPQTR